MLAKTSGTGPDVHAVGGALTINNGGTVQLGGTGGDQIYNGASVTVNTGGTLNMNGHDETVGGVNGAGVVRSGDVNSTITGIYAGTLASGGFGALNLAKTGAGILTLTNASIGGSTVTVNGGALVINGRLNASSLAVNSGGTVGGNGTIGSTTTVAAGGTLAPGVLTPGTLTFGVGLILQNGSTTAITLGGTTAGSYDQIRAGSGMSLAGTLSVSTVNSFTLAPGQTFAILNHTDPPSFIGTFSNAPGALFTDARGDTFAINYAAPRVGGGYLYDVTLTVLTVVPEPGTWVLVSVASGYGLILRRRQRARRA